MLQDVMPNNNVIFSHGTYVLCWHIPFIQSAPSPYALCGITVQLFIAFAKHLTSPRKRYRKTVSKTNKKRAPPKIDLILMFALPFPKLPAGINSHPCSLVCFFWPPVSWEHLNSWILCKPTFIWSHCVLIYAISKMNVLKNAFSDGHQILTNFSEHKYVCIVFFLLLSNLLSSEKPTLQFNGYCHTPGFFVLLLLVEMSYLATSFWVFTNNKCNLK